MRSWLLALSAVLCLGVASSAIAASEAIEEIVVTGSYIKGTPEDSLSPVDTTTREDFNLSGNPSIVEFIKKAPAMSGTDGEYNGFQSNGLEASGNVNLRGLGPGRTLALLNGARLPPNPWIIGETGQQYVNTNIIPDIALGRVELLKDGASSTYGSDAVAGVVNFITRSDFRGIEVQGSYKDIDDSTDDGDYNIGVIAGFGTDRLDVIASVGYQYRTEVNSTDRDWTLADITQNPRGGFSGFGSPGTYYPLDLSAGGLPDPDCELVGGILSGSCRFNFQDFFNIATEEEHLQVYLEANYTINDNWSVSAEILYSEDDANDMRSSPTFPPQVFLGLDRVAVPGMPHFDDFVTRNNLAGTPYENGVMILGRPIGVAGPSGTAARAYETSRYRIKLEGDINDSVSLTASFTYGESDLFLTQDDTSIDGLAWSFRGLGGVNCDRASHVDADPTNNAVPGQGDCIYYNHFTSGFTETNARRAQPGVVPPGSENAALNNDYDALKEYFLKTLTFDNETELTVIDVILSGESNIVAGGGNVGWAAGVQYREDEFSRTPNAINDNVQTACAFSDFGVSAEGDTFTIPEIDLGGGNSIPAWDYTCDGQGQFIFLPVSSSDSSDQDVVAVFGEINVPFTDNLEMQAAIRYEDYSTVGDTIDPKIAMRWQIADWVAVRGSMSTSYRTPSLNQLSGTTTTLQFVPATGAFKAIDTVGNPDLEPETATTYNYGILLTPTDNLYISLDWWHFDFEETLVLESFNAVTNTCFDPTSPDSGEACSKITFQDPANPSPGGFQRADVAYQNGPDMQTNGLDWTVTWEIPSDFGTWELGSSGSYINKYEVEAFKFVTNSTLDAVGDLNRFESAARSLPDMKGNFYVNWAMNNHNVRLEVWHVAEYDDKTEPAGMDWSIDAHTTLDLHYNGYFMDQNLRLFASVVNLTDEDPSFARLDLQYDPYTHNPFGRMIKVGFQYRFEGGAFQ